MLQAALTTAPARRTTRLAFLGGFAARTQTCPRVTCGGRAGSLYVLDRIQSTNEPLMADQIVITEKTSPGHRQCGQGLRGAS